MEDQELNLRKAPHKHNVGMALPMTLIFLLVGAVLVGTALYVVENMFSTSRHVVTETQLYNAAQSGIEQGRMVLWEKREALDLDEREYDGDLDSIRARREGASLTLDEEEGLWGMSVDGLSNLTVTVDILDCNYVFDGINVNDYEDLDVDQISELPPRWPGGESGAGTGSGSERPPEGTSVIIDPSRFFNIGGGVDPRQSRFVIRSTAAESNGVQQVKIEVMVVLTQ